MDISQSSSSSTNLLIHHDITLLDQNNDQLRIENNSNDENLILLRQQNAHLRNVLEKALSESNMLNEELKRVQISSRGREYEFVKKIEEVMRENQEFRSELDDRRYRSEKMLGESKDNLKDIKLVKECLARVVEYLDEFEIGNNNSGESKYLMELKMNLCREAIKPVRVMERVTEGLDEIKINSVGDVKQESGLISAVSMEIKAVAKVANEMEQKLNMCKTMRKKKMRELENRVMSLTKENQDLTNLLRIALAEKEAVEKNLDRLQETNEQKGVGILKIAERGLQKVGFGFIMGSGANEKSSDDSNLRSEDISECEEDAVSLAATVEGIMKDLRLEVTQLRQSLEESRSDSERLQILADKQAQELSENTLYIKELEDQQTLLEHNIADLLVEIQKAGDEVARWREACELEVEASNKFVKEHDRLVAILKQELEKTKAALNSSNGKLHLKQELAEAAMAAEAAAERSLRLADSRAAQLQEQIEELVQQLEEAEKRERSQRQRVRHICWPWRVLKLNPHANRTTISVQNAKPMPPETQSLLH